MEINESDFKSCEITCENEIHLDKIFKKLNNNNGWTKINDSATNIPDEGKWYRCYLRCELDEYGDKFTRVSRELFLDSRNGYDSIWLTLDNGELEENITVTHFKELLEELKPLD